MEGNAFPQLSYFSRLFKILLETNIINSIVKAILHYKKNNQVGRTTEKLLPWESELFFASIVPECFITIIFEI